MMKNNNFLLFTFITFLLYLLSLTTSCNLEENPQQATFAGSQTCLECHEKEYQSWQNSDHDNAMDTAIASTVLGDFNNSEFERNGFTSRFFIEDGKYYVHTKGPGGKAGDFQIAYTFGVRPLQQYLIPFENGRLQCLQITWDTERNQWYHLGDSVYKNQEILPDNWLYWTNNAQNWNAMCAECHSTNLQKNYNPKTHVYNTTWSEIDVACEACHGPGSEHNNWAEIDSLKRPKIANYGFVVQTSNISSSQLVNQCAYCHSRRSSFGDFIHPRKNLFDVMSPQLPIEPYYHADGQILEEDYVYASFTQSKMHQQKVRCTNCHDAHSLKLKYEGNNLCYQCHKQEDYGKYEHHFHKNFNEEGENLVLNNGEKIIKVGEGSQCITCHMPAQYFMGIDHRNDHSMRIPRPDLSDKLGTPNACIQCHSDKSNQWATSFTKKWYGKSTRFHFGETMLLAANYDTAAIPMLVNLINDENTSSLIKASATHYLSNFPTEKIISLNREMLNSNEALVRREAIRNFRANNLDDLKKTLLPLLDDPTKMIRMESAFKLSVIKPSNLDSTNARKLNNAIDEYINAMNYSADFAGSRHNLGNLYSNLGNPDIAIENYKEALRIDIQFYPAKVNLATLYNRIGNNKEAERLFIELTESHPELGNNYYSLGLLQAEMGKYDESILNLIQASKKLPKNGRILFNLFKIHDFKQNTNEAEISINRCLKLEPKNQEFLYAKIEFLLKQNRNNEAAEIAQQILVFYPGSPDKINLENFINSNKSTISE